LAAYSWTVFIDCIWAGQGGQISAHAHYYYLRMFGSIDELQLHSNLQPHFGLGSVRTIVIATNIIKYFIFYL